MCCLKSRARKPLPPASCPCPLSPFPLLTAPAHRSSPTLSHCSEDLSHAWRHTQWLGCIMWTIVLLTTNPSDRVGSSTQSLQMLVKRGTLEVEGSHLCHLSWPLLLPPLEYVQWWEAHSLKKLPKTLSCSKVLCRIELVSASCDFQPWVLPCHQELPRVSMCPPYPPCQVLLKHGV